MDKIEISINGESYELPAGSTLIDLVARLDLTPDRLAIERNRSIVSRNLWAETVIESGDALEIVHFVGGGEV